MNRAAELYQLQIEADRQHHRERVEWLQAENPTWSDGTPVSKSDRIELLRQSRDCLADLTGCKGFRSANVEELL